MSTVLIGLDGATFDLLDPLMEQGVMPNLKQFVTAAAKAPLRSTPTHITVQAWTSLATGRGPGSHGIFDFVRPEETDSGVYMKLMAANDIRSETIWSMANRQDRTVTLLNYPVTFPAPRVTGSVVPASVTVRHLKRAVRPPDLYRRLAKIPGFDPALLSMDMELEKKAIQGLSEEGYEAWIRLHLQRDDQWFRVLRHLMQTEPTDLTAVVFDGPDRIGHLAWPLLDPRLLPTQRTEWQERVHQLCLDCYRQIDRFIAEIIAEAGADTDVFVVSDHGFGPTWDIFYLNRWLEQQGYLRWGPSGAPFDHGDGLLAQQMKHQYGLIDWRRTVAFALTPSANGIHIRVADRPGRAGIPPGSYDAFREELIQGLGAVRDPETGEPIVREVLKREDVFAGSEMRRAPDLTLVLRDFGFISVLNSDVTLKRRREAKGLHRPDGIFLASGPSVSARGVVDRLSIMDVCPALLHSLGLPIPPDLDGRLPKDVLAPASPDLRPVPAMASSSVTLSVDEQEPGTFSPAEEEAVLSRLRGLGYIE